MAKPVGERIGPFIAVFCAIFSVCGITSLVVEGYPRTIPFEGKIDELIIQDLNQSIARSRGFFYVFLENEGVLSESGLKVMLNEAKKSPIVFRVILLSAAQQETTNKRAETVRRIFGLLPGVRGSFWTTGASWCGVGRDKVIKYPYAPRRVLRYNKEFEALWKEGV